MTVQAKVTSYQLLTRDSRPVGPVSVQAPTAPPVLHEAAAADAASVAAGNSEVFFDRLGANAVRTLNYDEEDGTKGSGKPVGTPLAGAKMDTEGTALKVAADNLQVGTYTLRDVFFRALNGLASVDATPRVWYRGNVDASVAGGAPNWSGTDLSLLLLHRRQLGTTGHGLVNMSVTVQPRGASNNLDSLRFLIVRYYYVDKYGTQAATTLSAEQGLTSHPFPDRLYRVPANDADILNAYSISVNVVLPAYSYTQYPAYVVQLVNSFGVSAGHCYYAGTNATEGITLATSGTAWPTAWGGSPPAPPPADGGGDPGTDCCAPWTPVRMANGSWRPASELRVGDALLTRPEGSSLYAVAVISHISAHEPRERWAIVTEDGRPLLFTPNHRLLRPDGSFTRIRDLRPGDHLDGSIPARVAQVGPLDEGPVLKITVDSAHTYDTAGIVSHNVKAL